MKQLTLRLLPGSFCVHRLAANAPIPSGVDGGDFFSATRTADELSVVCSIDVPLSSLKRESGFSCLQVLGVLDFSLTGIIAELSTKLAEAQVSIFAISTFNTDYVLFKTEHSALVQKTLQRVGHEILGMPKS